MSCVRVEWCAAGDEHHRDHRGLHVAQAAPSPAQHHCFTEQQPPPQPLRILQHALTQLLHHNAAGRKLSSAAVCTAILPQRLGSTQPSEALCTRSNVNT